MSTKRCTKCRETKAIGEFYDRSDRPGQTGSHCRSCVKSTKGDAWGKRRESQRDEDFAKNLERLRRNGMVREPWELNDMWGGPGGARAARRLGYEDVIEEPWQWQDGNIKAGGEAGNPYGRIGSWDRGKK